MVIPIASYFSLALYQRAENNYEKIDVSLALKFGLLTGLFAAFFGTSFDLLLTYIFHSNDFVYGIPEVEKMMVEYSALPEFKEVMSMFKEMSASIKLYGFSSGYAFFIFMNNIIVYPVFGIFGGLLSMYFINRREENK